MDHGLALLFDPRFGGSIPLVPCNILRLVFLSCWDVCGDYSMWAMGLTETS